MVASEILHAPFYNMKDFVTFSLSRGKTLVVGRQTLVAGTLNVTPDSFYDGGRYLDVEKAVARAVEHAEEGADIIDIGGESTRPGSTPVSLEEELARVIPVVRAVRERLGPKIIISVDTYKSRVAVEALDAGADIINSIGGFMFDLEMAAVVARYECPFAMYHVRGTPATMQDGEITYGDVIADITDFFETQIAEGVRQGMRREQFIIDPGIGFGKTLEHNLEIIRRLGEFKKLGLPILIGVSRKSHIGLLLKNELCLADVPPAEDRLEASLAEAVIAVLNGADIIRTHDVAETRRALAVVDAIKKNV